MRIRRRLVAVAAVIAILQAVAHVESLTPFVRGSWESIRHLHQGRPFIVHFWGITCAPCLGELPRWAELARERADVPILFVAADPVPVGRERVERALTEAGLTKGEHWMFGGEFFDPLRYEVSPDWAGELPLTLLVDRQGATTTLIGVADLAAVRAWLDGTSR